MPTEDGERPHTPERDPYYDVCEASGAGNLEEVQKFLDLPSDVPRSDRLQMALGISAETGHPQIVSWLLDHGADVTNAAAVGASNSRSIPVFQTLLDHGWNINQTEPQVLKYVAQVGTIDPATTGPSTSNTKLTGDV